jgi:hypothetical protein
MSEDGNLFFFLSVIWPDGNLKSKGGVDFFHQTKTMQ